jgi:hypothetical protein
MALLPLLAAWLAGCGREPVESKPDEGEPLQLFEKGRGVRLPEDMRQRLGVETAEVIEKPVIWRGEKPAHVYRAADGSKPGAAISFLSESEAGVLRPGQSVPLTSDDGKSPSITGTLARLDSRTGVAPGQVEVLIEFVDPEQSVPVGSLLKATFTGQNTNSVPAVPSAAIVSGAEGPFVYTVNGSHFTRTPVKLGSADGGWVAVVDGLYAGDSVVAKAAETLWMIELCALKGGTPCCPAPMKGKEK